jgi:WD40 repeat protein
MKSTIIALAALLTAAPILDHKTPRLVSGGADQTIRIWDGAGKEIQNILAHDATVTALALTGDGKTAYSASADRTIKSWNLEDGSRTNTLEGHDQEVTCVALSPNGKTLASGSADQSVRLWNTLTGIQTRRIPAHSKAVRAVAWSPDGQFLASTGADKLIQIWRADGAPAGTIVSQDDAVTSLVWTMDSASLLTGDLEGNLKLWSARDLSVTARQRAHERAVTVVALNPNGSRIATAGADGRVKTWTFMGKGFMEGKETPPGRSLNSLAWSPDSAFLISGGADRTVRIWNADDLTEVRKINAHDAAVTAAIPLTGG